jgi:hypothetical protein
MKLQLKKVMLNNVNRLFCGYMLNAVLRIRIRDPGSGIRCLFDPWIRDPE